ncbi:MAG: DUF4388 domain-containing protein [Deltaproteobacteria bacterium]|nr:DUF4388 domain-containing protein [Deltaproteobacteria bacterium]
MGIQGTLDDFTTPELLQLIGLQGKTGVLMLQKDDLNVKVEFSQGHVVRASPSSRNHRYLLGNMLVRAGLVTEAEIEVALAIHKETGVRLGDVLINQGKLDRHRLDQILKLQTTETLYELFLWQSGTFEFTATEVEAPDEKARLRAQSILLEGFRQLDEWPAIRAVIPHNTTTFVRLEDTRADLKGDITPEARMIFDFVATGVSVQQIVDKSHFGEFDTCAALVRLVQAGLIQPVADPGAARLPPPAATPTDLPRLRATICLAVGSIGVHSEYQLDPPRIRSVAHFGDRVVAEEVVPIEEAGEDSRDIPTALERAHRRFEMRLNLKLLSASGGYGEVVADVESARIFLLATDAYGRGDTQTTSELMAALVAKDPDNENLAQSVRRLQAQLRSADN